MIESLEQILSHTEFMRRIDCLRDRMRQAGIEKVVIYGDEYHFENLNYLCGYRPVFEMALLIVGLECKSLLLTGYEGETLAELHAYNCRIRPFGPFSVQGMEYEERTELASELQRDGFTPGMQVGVVGPRYFEDSDLSDHLSQQVIPDFIIRAILQVVGNRERIINITSWFTKLPAGIRSRKSAVEIALLEEAGTRASRGVVEMMQAVHPGVRERELLGFAQAAVPSAHYSYPPVIHSGVERCRAGLLSPNERVILQDDPVVIYYSPSVEGYSGNCGRSGVLAADPGEFSPELSLGMMNLFTGTHQSYLFIIHHLCEGAVIKSLIDDARYILKKEGLDTFYSPIHSTGLTEWENSFDARDSSLHLESGNVLQVDFTIFSPEFPVCPAKIEDGFAIADFELRQELENISPRSYQRIAQRRTTLEEHGIHLHASVLPLSDLVGQFFPFILSANYQLLTKC